MSDDRFNGVESPTKHRKKRTRNTKRRGVERDARSSEMPPRQSPAEGRVTYAELLGSVNQSCASARNAWLALLVLLLYFLVTLGSVTHEDLFLNNPVALPIVNVEIPLSSFFTVAPIVLLFIHLGLLMQHAILGYKCHQLSQVSTTKSGDHHPSDNRQVVHSYAFCQLIAGPDAPRLVEWVMRLIIFFTLIATPVITLLYFQIVPRVGSRRCPHR